MSQAGSYYSSVNFLLPQQPPSELPAQLQNALSPLYIAMQQVIQTFTNNCGVSSQPPDQWANYANNYTTVLINNARRMYLTASEDMNYGAMAQFYQVDIISHGVGKGVVYARNASSLWLYNRQAHGFCNVAGGVKAGQVGEFIFKEGIVKITGLNTMQDYYLSPVKGKVMLGPDTIAGDMVQYIGYAIAEDTLYVNMDRYTATAP